MVGRERRDGASDGRREVIVTRRAAARVAAGPFELLMLTALPCGCIVADYRAPTLAVDLIALEAKGPYCRHADHRADHVLALGASLDVDDADVPDDTGDVGSYAAVSPD